MLDPNQQPIDPSNIRLNKSSAESNKNRVGTDEEERETPPDQIITSKKFMTAKNSKGSSPMETDGPSYIDKSTTKNLADLNLKNQLSGAPGRSSDSGSVEDFDSRKNKFNKQIGMKELQEFIKEEASSQGHTGSDPATTKAKDTPDLEFKKPGERLADDQRDLHRVTSYNNIAPLSDDLSSESEQKKWKSKKEADKEVKPSVTDVANQLNINDAHAKNLIEEVMGVSPNSEQSFKHSGDLNPIHSEGYLGLKMNDPSQATSTEILQNTQPMISPASHHSHQSPLSHDPIKIVIGEKAEEVPSDKNYLFESVPVAQIGTKSPLSNDSAN